MVNYLFNCPFCRQKMSPYSAGSSLQHCNNCKLIVSPDSGKASFTAASPFWESYQCLLEIHRTVPTLVMSPTKLWDVNFKLKDCTFIGCTMLSQRVNCIMIDKVKVPIQIQGNHLIAGRNLYADHLVDSFISTVMLESPTDVMSQKSYKEPDEFVWSVVLLENAKKYSKDSEVQRLIHGYFSPVLEGSIDSMFGLFGNYKHPITDESALYTMIFSNPCVNVGWSPGLPRMQDRVKRYCAACVRDTSDVDLSARKPIDYSLLNMLVEPWRKDFVSLYYTSMPSTAVNVSDGKFSSFCIMNHEFMIDILSKYSHDDLTPEKLKALLNTYHVFTVLNLTYAGSYSVYGLKFKEDFIREHNVEVTEDVDKTVLDFWKLVEELLHKEIYTK